jgi:DeoR/GlpR family transcriptional regulator of sugar metabolism
MLTSDEERATLSIVTGHQMLARQRQARILEEVRRLGGARVSSLTQLLGVSDMTIRRDLEALAHRGLVEKVHGGATAVPEHSTDEPGFEAKFYRQLAEKEAISAAAAELVEPGGAIGVTAGTTTWALAAHLADVPGLTVVTNSIPVAERLNLAGRSDQTVVLTGGVRTPSDALVGPVAVNAIRSLHVDMVFMGVHGMDERGGFTTPNLVEADTNRAFVAAARRLAVLADHTKWGVVGLSSIAALDEAEVLITDDGLDDAAAEILRGRIVDVRVVPTQPAVEEAVG